MHCIPREEDEEDFERGKEEFVQAVRERRRLRQQGKSERSYSPDLWSIAMQDNKTQPLIMTLPKLSLLSMRQG